MTSQPEGAKLGDRGALREPEFRECACENCGRVEFVNGPLVPTPGIVCDICRRSPCSQCDGQMLPTHPEMLAAFHEGTTNAVAR